MKKNNKNKPKLIFATEIYVNGYKGRHIPCVKGGGGLSILLLLRGAYLNAYSAIPCNLNAFGIIRYT